MPGRATKAPAAPVHEVEVQSDAGAEETNGEAPAPTAASEPILTGQDHVMTRAAAAQSAQQDLENRLRIQEAQSAVAKASRDLYKSAFNIFAGTVLAALKGGDAGDVAKGLQAESMEQAIKDSSTLLTIKALQGCALTGKKLSAEITQVYDLAPKILDSMSAENVIAVQSLIVPIFKGQATWEKVNYSVSEKCRKGERGVPGLVDLVNDLCAGAGANHLYKDEFEYVKVAAVTAVAVMLSSELTHQ